MEKTAKRTVYMTLKKQVQEKVYYFDELAEDVQARLIAERAEDEKKSHEQWGYDMDYIREMFEDDLHGFDFELSDWWYQCAYCQGDGAAFSGSFELPDGALRAAEMCESFTKEERAAIWDYMEDVKINMGGGSCPYMEAEYYFNPDDYLERQNFYDRLEGKFEKALKEWAEDRAAYLYDLLINEMEYRDSEENAREYLMYCADGYYFADGTEVNEQDIVA